jgi:hypothetical protein
MGLRFSIKVPSGVVSPDAGWQDNVGDPPAYEIEYAEGQNVTTARLCVRSCENILENFGKLKIFGCEILGRSDSAQSRSFKCRWVCLNCARHCAQTSKRQEQGRAHTEL